MTKAIQDFLSELQVNLSQLNDYDNNIISAYDNYSLLKYPGLRDLNPYLTGSFIRLLSSNDPFQFFLDFVNAVNKESEIIIMLTTEWFSQESHDLALINSEGVIDAQVITDAWPQHYTNLLGLRLFHRSNADYTNIINHYRGVLESLYRGAGLPHSFIEEYFSEKFQEFFKTIEDFTVGIFNQDYKSCFNAIAAKLNSSPQKEIQGKDEFNRIVENDISSYVAMISYLMENFSKIRRATEAIIESHLTLESHNPAAGLKGDFNLTLTEFEDFNKLLTEIVESSDMAPVPKWNRVFKKYLEDLNSGQIRGTGFSGLVKRQLSFKASFNPTLEAVEFAKMSSVQKQAKITNRNKDVDDMSILHRLRFILRNRPLLSMTEIQLLDEKLTAIIKSQSSNFYADVVELYYYFLMKVSGVPIELLESQTANGNEVSTCDYKFGDRVAADCKCIITDQMRLQNISSWCGKIGSQVNSTIGYKDVVFGGGVIALKDQEIDFLEPFRTFTNDKSDLNEKAAIIGLLMTIYSEFRRHTLLHPDKVKFIILYYIPTSHIKAQDIEKFQVGKFKQVNEIMAIMATKYSTDEELSVLAKIFRPVAHYIFRFNNQLQLN